MSDGSDLRSIDQWLTAARADIAHRAPDAHAGERALLRFRERQALAAVAASRVEVRPPDLAPTRPMSWRLWFGVPLAAFATVVLLIGALALTPAGEPHAVETAATPFVALASAEQLRAASDAVVISAQVPRVALADYGLPVDPARADQPVDAEFLMSRAGVVLAIRFKE